MKKRSKRRMVWHNDQELAERADDASLGFGITAPPSQTRDRKVTVDSVLFSSEMTECPPSADGVAELVAL